MPQRSRLQSVRRTVRGFGKILHGLRVKFNADFEYDISSDHIRASGVSGVRYGLQIFGSAAQYVLFTFALLSERCNYVKMIAAQIFIETVLVENCSQNIFGNLKFSSKVHIL